MDYSEKIKKLSEIIDKSYKVVAFTGAGISCPSGIPDFRSADGLYNQKSGIAYPPEEIISHGFFFSHTKEFYDFYFSKMVYETAKPNFAHLYLARLEEKGKLLATVTQNIDGLHQKAGSKEVFELHGSVLRNNCTVCNRFHTLEEVKESAKINGGVPRCKVCGKVVKPDVVLYDEPLDEETVEGAINAISVADTLIIIGTSLTVYPAAGFINFFKGKHLVLINKSETRIDKTAELVINEDAAKAFYDLSVFNGEKPLA